MMRDSLVWWRGNEACSQVAGRYYSHGCDGLGTIVVQIFHVWGGNCVPFSRSVRNRSANSGEAAVKFQHRESKSDHTNRRDGEG